ncbi:unnamed protein product [Staurois parvus]|uniref:Uncharacterized protein n=1 Tax=Staurois parvus TaxID=386267 RepID=A0ABN9D272_9NEOB|nr:unnamed protein product [Staurois parvus]
MSPLIRKTEPVALLHKLSLVCIVERVHVISTGRISALQTEVRGSPSS